MNNLAFFIIWQHDVWVLFGVFVLLVVLKVLKVF